MTGANPYADLRFREIKGNRMAYCLSGVHFLQEDSSHEISSAIADFVRRLRVNDAVTADRMGSSQ